MSAVTDFHTHILPGIDDGSDSVELSLRMLRAEAQQGITHVVATPHFYAHHQRLSSFLSKRKKAVEQLAVAMQEEAGLPRLSVGAEVYYFEGISKVSSLEELAIEGTDYLLIEMPLGEWTERNFEELEEIYSNWGLTPIVAHIDRYIRPLRTHGIPERLAQLPVLVQANASFFTQHSTRRLALKLLQEDQIHLLGSDCHNMKLRPPMLADALEIIQRKLGRDALDRIVGYQQDIFGLIHCESND